jgi:hypothetical protein
VHGLIVGQGTAPVSSVSPGTLGQVLVSNGGAADPTFQVLNVTVPQGGTGVAALTNHGVVIGQGAVAVHVTSPGTAGQVLTSNGASADPTFQAPTSVSVDVPHGGTGVATLPIHGVLIGQGTSPVTVTGTGTAGQVLTSNGAGADPTFQSGTATYPPSPVPDFQTFVQAAFTAGQSANWIWGNYLLNAPATITMNANRNSFVVNLNGAIISPSGTYTVNTAIDMVTFIVPDGSPGTLIQNFRLLNGVFSGNNPSVVKACRNPVMISCHLAASTIYNGSIENCAFSGGTRSGCQLYGAIQQYDIVSCSGYGNVFAGVEMLKPNAVGAGISSSINFWGGNYRDNGSGGAANGYGIASTAETPGQDSFDFNVHGSNFSGNTSAGLLGPTGIKGVNGATFVNNCTNNAAETHGAIWVINGHATVEMCTCSHSTGNGQTLALDISSPTLTTNSFVSHTVSFNKDTGVPDLVAKLNAGTGTMWLSSEFTVGNLDTTNSAGAWSVRAVTTTATTV